MSIGELIMKRILKRSLIFFGVIFLVFIIIIIVMIAIGATIGSRLDKESKQYVDAATVRIISDWDKQELVKHASPELMAATNDKELDKLLDFYRKLGKLKQYKGSEGNATISVTTQHGKVISARYVATAEFEAGLAQIKIELIKHGDNWQIFGFHVDSKVFLDLQ
jgi:Na+-transporting methylmalonyl-CoA/oxaloacetate decarboxylase gamma subunit